MKINAQQIAEQYAIDPDEAAEYGFNGKFGKTTIENATMSWDETTVANFFEKLEATGTKDLRKNIEALVDLGADAKILKTGDIQLQNTFSTWFAYLKYRYGDQLAVDVHDPVKLYRVTENTPEAFKTEELPEPELMIKDLHDNFDVQTSSLRQSLDAFHIADINLRKDTQTQYNFFEEQLKRLEHVWEEKGKPSVIDDLFVYLFKLPDTDYNRAVGLDWLNGAVYNMTKGNHEEPYIRSLDILDTDGGSGKSSFIEYSNALILGLPGKKSATFNFDVNNDFMYSMLVGAPFIHDAELRMSRRAAKGSGADDEKGAAWKDFTAQPDYSFQRKGSNDTTNIPHYFTVVRSSNKTKVYGDIMANETERRFMPIVSHRHKSDMLFTGDDWAEQYREFLKLVWGEAYHRRHHPSTQMSSTIAAGAQVLQQRGADGYAITDNLSNLLSIAVPPTLNSMPLVQAAAVLSDLAIYGKTNEIVQTPDWLPYSEFDVLKQNVLVSAMKKVMQQAKLNITNQEKLTNMIDGYVVRYGFSSEAVHRNLKIDGIEHQQANYYERVNAIDDLREEANILRDQLISYHQKKNLTADDFEELRTAFIEKVNELGTYNTSYVLDYLTVMTELLR